MKKIQDEIIKDFLGITKNRSVKMIFLKKFAHANLFISKSTGQIIPGNINSAEKNLAVWDQRYKSKFYSSKSPHFLSRHIYTTAMVEDKFSKKIKIADLGCGEASLIEVLNKFYGLENIYGFEHSKAVYNKNKKKFKNKRIKFVNSSIERIDELKFKNYFDLVFLTWTLGSSARPDKLIDKVYKILKLNGLVVISESSRILVRPKVSIFWYFNNFNTFKNYPWRFSSNSIKNLLTLFNFKISKTNNFEDNDNLVVVGKKISFIKKKKYKFDNYKKVIKFFKIWLKNSKAIENI